MSKIKIVRTDSELQCPAIDAQLRDLCDEFVLLPDGISEADLLKATVDADLLLMCYTPITAAVIANARNLKGIVKYGVGIDAINIPAAKSKGIPVVNVPEYAEETVAEAAFALLLSLAKKLIPIDRGMHTAGWLWPLPDWIGSDIAGKTVGLIGVGRIGRSMARMAGAGFRAKVLGFDPNVSQSEMDKSGVEKCELAELLARSDFVSVHCVLNTETKHIIGKQELAAMKKCAFLINVSRGALVDEVALVEALKAGEIAGAGLDVYSQEPLELTSHPMSELFEMPNVILLPHLAFYTSESMERLTQDTIDRSKEILAGELVTVKSSDPRLRGQANCIYV